MSEKQPNTPDTDRKKSPYYIEGAPEALQIDAIEKLREAQAIHERAMEDQEAWNDFDARDRRREEAHQDFDRIIKEYLIAHGINEDDEKFKEYKVLLREYSFDRISYNEWNNDIVDADGTVHPSPRLEMVDVLREKYGNTPDTTPPPPDNPTPPDNDPTKVDDPDKDKDKKSKTREEVEKIITEKYPNINALRTGVAHLRSELAEVSAKRQGRISFFEGEKLREEYETKKRRYDEKLNELIKLELEAEREIGLERTPEEERIDNAFKLINSFKELQQESVDILKDTKVGKIVTWLTKGGTVKRILKGAAVGVAAGAVGTAVTAFTGGGALAGVLAALPVLSARFARGFATFDNRKGGRGMQVIDPGDRTSSFNLTTIEEAGAGDKSPEEAIALIHQHLMDLLEQDTKKEQGKRLKSTVYAMGSMAVGAALTEGIASGVDAYGDRIGDLYDKVMGNNPVNAAGHPPGPPAGVPDIAPPAPETLYSPDALAINPGEGWYQTFEDMGIPQKDWPTLLEQAGPKLHDIQVDGHPVAYQMPDGQWGIRMTPDGMMPKEALDVITQTHDHITGVADVASAPSAPAHIEAPGTGAPSGAPTAELTSGGAPSPDSVEALTAPVDHASMENIIKMDVIHPSDVAGNTQLEHLTHVATWYSPDTLGQRLGVPAVEWDRLQDYIAAQVTRENNVLYRDVFTVNPDGYLQFTTNHIPNATMADMLNHVPQTVRDNMYV